jgi:cytochrome c oxidase assembly protein subunit 15
MNKSVLRTLINMALLLALGVVMLGAYTRLTDAGLGCPDWPGCYGHLVLPSQKHVLDSAQQLYPDVPIEEGKAWTEMAHRYLAGSLLTFIVVIFSILTLNRKFKGLVRPIYLIAVFALLVFQALLGMWTVTLKLLPTVVMGHLLGGFLIFSILTVLRCYFFEKKPLGLTQFRPLLVMGLVITFCQIALGGWVSSNYAGISCMGFPACSGQWWPTLNLKEAFDVIHPIGLNYQGGLLDIQARMTIQWVHRLGALLVWVYWLVSSIYLWKKVPDFSVRFTIFVLQSFLNLQILLGIANVVYLLPLPVAVLHNGMGLLVLASSIVLTCLLVGQRESKNV